MSEGREIIEAAQWQQRNDKRVPILDMNFDPPRVVRYVGWQPCIRGGLKFFSHDVALIRMCVLREDGRKTEVHTSNNPSLSINHAVQK